MTDTQPLKWCTKCRGTWTTLSEFEGEPLLMTGENLTEQRLKIRHFVEKNLQHKCPDCWYGLVPADGSWD